MISSERRERAKICVLLRRKNVLHTDHAETREKAIINDCEQSNCACVSETCDSSHTGGVQGPPYRAPGGVQGQRALEFSANKGIQDGRQE